ncbi:uncharacterized protein J3R85_002359 [Psidium guajava]|nr:uncharacterized protein J3R85_002359 [Psidium guajava]
MAGGQMQLEGMKDQSRQVNCMTDPSLRRNPIEKNYMTDPNVNPKQTGPGTARVMPWFGPKNVYALHVQVGSGITDTLIDPNS